jgi:hypothetical protein
VNRAGTSKLQPFFSHPFEEEKKLKKNDFLLSPLTGQVQRSPSPGPFPDRIFIPGSSRLDKKYRVEAMELFQSKKPGVLSSSRGSETTTSWS